MEKEKLDLINELNGAIVKFRGYYSAWSARQGMSYHELLICYSIREYGVCTQKQICDSYLLPKQTIHHVFGKLRNAGILQQLPVKTADREKVFVLTEMGKEYFSDFIVQLDAAETAAFEKVGQDKLQKLRDLFLEYDSALKDALKGGKKNGKR